MKWPRSESRSLTIRGADGATAAAMVPDTSTWDDDTRRQAALTALGDVWDPELGLDIVSMGLVYDVRVDDGAVTVDMTLTTPGCPVSEQLPAEAEEAVRAALPQSQVTINVVWDPPWTPERLTPEAVAKLGYTPRS